MENITQKLTAEDLEALADEASRQSLSLADRQLAILALACGVKRFDEHDLEAICQLADEDGLSLAEMVMDKSLWRPLP